MAKNLGTPGNGGNARIFSDAQAAARTAGNSLQMSSQDIQDINSSGYIAPEGSNWVNTQGRLMGGIAERPGVMMDEQATIANTAFLSTDTAEEIQMKTDALERLGLGKNDYAWKHLTFDESTYLDKYDKEGIEAPRAFAALTDVPTSTTNYKRPRTVAAGWSPNDSQSQKGTLTVVFRDGTPYNFYDVPYSVWIKFHQSISKGRPYLNSQFPKEYSHGPADVSSLPEGTRQAIMDGVYQAARLKQIYYRTPTTGKGHYTTTYGSKKTLTKRDRPVYDANGAPKISDDGYFIV